jgi:hypothetical protein
MRRFICIFLMAILPVSCATPAQAGAWLVAHDRMKLLINRLTETAPNRPFLRGRELYLETAKIERSKLHVEFGLNAHFALEGIIEHGARRIGHRQGESMTARPGVRFNAPHLAVGLLPPYFFQLLEGLFPNRRFTREKRASIMGALMAYHTRDNGQDDANHGHYSEVALADKVNLGAWSFTQSIESGKTHMADVEWDQHLYRFEIGSRNRLSFGT